MEKEELVKYDLNYLKSLLFFSISEYNEELTKREEVLGKNDVYKEIVGVLKSGIDAVIKNYDYLLIQLYTMYPNNPGLINRVTNLFYRYKNINPEFQDVNKEKEILQSKIDGIIDLIKDDYENNINVLSIHNEFIINQKDNMINYRRILSSLKYNQVINGYQMGLVIDLMNKKSISNDNQIKLLEVINAHNKSLIQEYTRKQILDHSSITKMIDRGFEDFDIKNINKDIIAEASMQLKQLDFYESNSDFINYLNDFYKDDFEKYKLIIKSILDEIQDKMSFDIECVKDKDFYFDKKSRNDIVMEFKKYNDLYLRLRALHDKKLTTDDNFDEEIIGENDNQINRLLLFTHKSNGDSYMMSDLKDVPFEYYDRVIKLLNDFEKKDLKDIDEKLKSTNDIIKGFIKLKDDQVRIIVKHLAGPYYMVMGCGVKKQDSANDLYSRLVSRCISSFEDFNDISNTYIETGVNDKQEIVDFCKNNSRISSR